MICAGCQAELKMGDLYIEGTVAEYLSRDADPLDDLVAEILGSTNGQIVFCEACTEPGGKFMFHTFYGDADVGTE